MHYLSVLVPYCRFWIWAVISFMWHTHTHRHECALNFAFSHQRMCIFQLFSLHYRKTSFFNYILVLFCEFFLHNFASKHLENLHHFFNVRDDFQFNRIWYRWSVAINHMFGLIMSVVYHIAHWVLLIVLTFLAWISKKLKSVSSRWIPVKS